jgi:hypothetical protein
MIISPTLNSFSACATPEVFGVSLAKAELNERKAIRLIMMYLIPLLKIIARNLFCGIPRKFGAKLGKLSEVTIEIKE